MAALAENIGLVFRMRSEGADKVSSDLKKVSKDVDAVDKNLKDTDKNDLNNSSEGVSKLSSGLSAAVPIAAAVAAGMAAVASAVVGVTTELFNLSKSVSEGIEEIDRFNKLTGFSVETIQSLQSAAKQAGTSLDEIEEVFESFVELMIEGGQGAEDAVQKVKSLGLDPQKAYKDLEGSFLKVLDKIREMPTQAGKAKVAMDGMGESGLNMVKVADAMTGGTAAYIKTLKEQGRIIDAEGIRKGKEFAKQYKEVESQIKAVTVAFALEFMPVFTDGMKEVSRFFRENKNDVKLWGTLVKGALEDILAVVGLLARALNAVNVAFAEAAKQAREARNDPQSISSGNSIATGRFGSPEQAQALDNKGIAPPIFKPTAPPINIEGGLKQVNPWEMPPDPDLIKKQQEEAEKRRQQELADRLTLNKELESSIRDHYARQREANEEFYKNATIGRQQFLDQTKVLLEAEAIALKKLANEEFDIELARTKSKTAQQALAVRHSNTLLAIEDEFAQKLKQVGEGVTEDARKESEKRIKVSESEQNRRLALQQATAEKENAEDRVHAQTRLNTQREQLSEVLNVRADLLTEEMFLIFRGHKQKLFLIDEEIENKKKLSAQFAKESEERKQIENDIAILETQRAQEALEYSAQIRNAKQAEIDKINELKEASRTLLEPGGERRQADDVEGVAIDRGFFGTMADELDELLSKAPAIQNFQSTLAGMGKMMADMMLNMADATGQAIAQWALYGGSVGEALKMALAAELAHIAGVATVNALYATALGFLRLAQWDFAAAGNAFVSAGMWAALAGGVALAARAVAGDSQNAGRAFNSATTQSNAPDYQTVSQSGTQNNSQPGGSFSQQQAEQIKELSAAIQHLTGMQPGDVLTKGATQRRGFIASQATKELKENSTVKGEMGRALGLA
jgi:hypothetical protein